ncbi:MAG: CBS domain-containing protein [Telluria sp.]
MRVGEICTVQTIYCKRDESVQGAALLMRKYHVGDLVVIDSLERERIPVDIITDRDIVVSVIALGLDPGSLLVGDIMSDDLLTASADDDVYETIERMRVRGIRRGISSHQQAHEKRARQ